MNNAIFISSFIILYNFRFITNRNKVLWW